MRLSFAPNLLTRVMLLVTIGLLLIFGGFALLGLQAVSESTERTLQERLLITQITAGRVDDLLQQKIVALEAVAGEDSIDPESENREAFGPTLRVLGRQLGDFSNYVALINGKGKVVWTEPYIPRLIGSDLSSNRYVANALSTGQPTISGFFSVSEMEPTAAILVPRRKPGGSVNALVYAAVNLRHPSITRLLSRLEIGKTGYAEIVDEDGFPLVSTWAEQPWQKCRYSDRFATLIRERQTTVGRCHDCHTASTDRRQGVMAFAALATAPWGVVVQQGEQEAFANTKTLEQRLFFFGAMAFLMTLLIAWLLTRSVVSPIQALTAACQRIASGDLDQPIPSFGKDEVGVLARSFNAMRERLKSSLEEIRGWNLELERRVGQRTKELEEAEQGRRELLRKLVVVQEEEHRRLARELHDETSQALTALVVGLDTTLTARAESTDEIKGRLASIKPLAVEMLREIQRIIHDLRPAILDDLGLVQAIDWYAESRLESQGIRVALETAGGEKRLSAELETVVFRIAQEAINNIARHARAENVNIGLDFADSVVILDIEDDGCGFDTEAVLAYRKGDRSFGLLGITERVALFGGALKIESRVGQGTRITARIPVEGTRWNGEDTSLVSG